MVSGLVGDAFVGDIDNTGKQEWLSLAQKQQESIRGSDVGRRKAHVRSTKNLAATTKYSLESSQSAINKIAKKNGAIVTTKTLALGKSAKTDNALKVAEQTNQFDKVFQEILKKELNDYQTELKKLYESSTGKTTKTGLSTAYTNAGLLATEANR